VSARNFLPTEYGGFICKFDESLTYSERKFLAATKDLDPKNEKDRETVQNIAKRFLFKKTK
jgi:hypothetical protein